MPASSVRVCVVAIGIVGLIACSDPTLPAADAGADTGLVSCAADPLVQPYHAGMTVAAADGQVSLQLLKSDPAPPVSGANTWTLRILGADGKPLAGATLEALLPYMPHHGHHGSVLATATAAVDGAWTVTPLTLAMPGVWQVAFAVKVGGVAHDVSFYFCTEG